MDRRIFRSAPKVILKVRRIVICLDEHERKAGVKFGARSADSILGKEEDLDHVASLDRALEKTCQWMI